MLSVRMCSLILLTLSVATFYAVWADGGKTRQQLAQASTTLYAKLQQRTPQSGNSPNSAVGALTLTIDAVPRNARVRIMNITPVYRPGLALPEGRYDLEVSAKGYQTLRTWIQLDAEHQVFRARLRPQE